VILGSLFLLWLSIFIITNIEIFENRLFVLENSHNYAVPSYITGFGAA
jgi:hypothetical protein